MILYNSNRISYICFLTSIMKRLSLFFLVLFSFSNSFSQCTTGLLAGAQLVTNGNFNAGNTGFNSVSNYSCTCGSNQYCVTTNSNLKCDAYGVMGNGGSGNFLMIDSPWASNNAGTGVDVYWKQNINLTANTDYNFSFFQHGFAFPLISLPPAIISIYINGIQQGGNITTGPYTGAWTKYNLNFNSGLLSGPIAFEIRPASLQPTSSGWELGLDDFSLTTCSSPMPIDIVSFKILNSELSLSASNLDFGTKCTFFLKNRNGDISILEEKYCYNYCIWKMSTFINFKGGEVWACLESEKEKKCSTILVVEDNTELPLKVELYSIQGVLLRSFVVEEELDYYIQNFNAGVFLVKYIFIDRAETQIKRQLHY